MTSPVAGLRVGKVLPEAESTHLLLMSSLVAETFTVGSKTVVAVAMISSSLGEHSRKGTPVRGGKQERGEDVEDVMRQQSKEIMTGKAGSGVVLTGSLTPRYTPTHSGQTLRAARSESESPRCIPHRRKKEVSKP